MRPLRAEWAYSSSATPCCQNCEHTATLTLSKMCWALSASPQTMPEGRRVAHKMMRKLPVRALVGLFYVPDAQPRARALDNRARLLLQKWLAAVDQGSHAEEVVGIEVVVGSHRNHGRGGSRWLQFDRAFRVYPAFWGSSASSERCRGTQGRSHICPSSTQPGHRRGDWRRRLAASIRENCGRSVLWSCSLPLCHGW